LGNCPATDDVAGIGTTCHAGDGACNAGATCDGFNKTCPSDVYVCSITGNVYYYTGLDPALDPTAVGNAKPVTGVRLDLTGMPIPYTTTDTAGAYGFHNLFGSVTITPADLLGGAGATLNSDNIGSLDAAAIARSAVLIPPALTPNQRTAGDVTGDTTVSAYDASYVARFAVGLVARFPVAIREESDWAFAPLSHSYALDGSQTGQNFLGIVYGDVTGNWPYDGSRLAAFGSSSATAKSTEELAADQELAALLNNRPAIQATRSQNAGPALIQTNEGTGSLKAGERRQITISLQNADGILGLDMSLGYDSSRIKIVDVQGTGLGASFIWAKGGQGQTYKLAGYGIDPLSGSGQLLTVTVEALRNAGGPNLLSVRASANEGAIPLEVRANGRDLLPRP
jgi:hypothetical protein